MKNEEWRMADAVAASSSSFSEEWKVKSEKWKIALTQFLNEEWRMKNEEWELHFLVKSEEWKIALTQFLNEECRMKNEEWELVLFSWVWLYKKPQSEERNLHSSFFILHSSFSPEGVLFSSAKHIVKQKPKSVTLCILLVKRESIIWKKKEGDKQILKLC